MVPQRQYDPAKLAEAASLVKRGRMSGRKAADMFSVPRTTLRRYMKAKQPPKKRMLFTEQEELAIADYCSNLCRMGLPLRRKDIRANLQETFQFIG